ncbi:MAG TPA: ROK family protein [Clostridiales bacterium]|jgi:fructokinase|nr:ROK family protein [Clostridiales bacterium]
MKIGGLEAGGTKMVCAIGNENGELLKRVTIPTEQPSVTMPKLIDFFQKEEIEALGIGCFGPLDLNKASNTYGCITSTPKLPWRNYNIVNTFKKALNVPIGFDTDVNAAALGEATWGTAKNCEVSIYITIGTGIGVGLCIQGKPHHGLIHPEAGHILLGRLEGDNYNGNCPYHSDCFEGLASGPAIEGRFGKKAYELADRSDVWEMESSYIAKAITNYILTLSPNKITLWGGVMHQTQLFPMIREKVLSYLSGYLHSDIIENHIDHYILPPSLGDDAGIKGAIRLGYFAMNQKPNP